MEFGEGCLLHVQGVQDALTKQLFVAHASGLLQDHAKENIAGIAVLPPALLTGPEIRPAMGKGIFHQTAGGAGAAPEGAVVSPGADQFLTIIPETGGMVGQLPQGHLPAMRYSRRPTGQPAGKGIVHTQDSLFGKLEEQDSRAIEKKTVSAASRSLHNFLITSSW